MRSVIAKVRHAVNWLSVFIQERRLGIHSEAEVHLAQYGVTEKGCHHYNGTNYVRFWQIMRRIKIRPREDVFLDLGSGMGRVVVLAATYSFRKVIGVELIEELNDIARENVRKAMPGLKCRDIELHNVDARNYRIPPEVTVIYLWNPFGGEVLARVFSNIRESIMESPRTVTILYVTPPDPSTYCFLDSIKDQLPWLPEPQRLRLGGKLQVDVYTCEGSVAEASPLAPDI
jgi:SAM-dependent methyltransferase